MFGLAAHGEAGLDSDIDLLLVRQPLVSPEEENLWAGQIDALRESVCEWSGNELEVLALSAEELRHLRDGNVRLIDDLRADDAVLAVSTVRDILLGSKAATR